MKQKGTIAQRVSNNDQSWKIDDVLVDMKTPGYEIPTVAIAQFYQEVRTELTVQLESLPMSMERAKIVAVLRHVKRCLNHWYIKTNESYW